MKKPLLLALLIVVAVVLVGAAYYSLQKASYSRGKIQTARNIADVPVIGQRLKGLSASDTIYLHIHRYRYDEYLLAGQTTAGSLEGVASANQHVFLYKESHENPPDDIAHTFQEIRRPPANGWSSKNWLLHGTLQDGTSIILGFDSNTGEFWAVVRLPRSRS